MKTSVISLILFIICGCFGKSPSIHTGHEGKALPSINVLLTDSTTQINISKFTPKGTPIVLFYFSPKCPYCRTLTKDIIDNMKDLTSINFYMISNFSLAEIRKYSNHFKISNFKNIIIGQDTELYFSNYFNAPGVPCIAIYDKNKILKQVLMGAVKTNVIKDIAFE